MWFDNDSYYINFSDIRSRSERREACNRRQSITLQMKAKNIYAPLAPQSDLNPLSLLISLLLHLRAKRNRTHDTIAKLLVNHTLVRISVVLHNLIKSVHQRLARRHLERAATVGEVHQLGLAQLGFGDLKDLGQLLQVFFVGWGVAVEHGGGGDFLAAEVFGDGFEGEVLGFLRVEEDAAVGGESRGDGLL